MKPLAVWMLLVILTNLTLAQDFVFPGATFDNEEDKEDEITLDDLRTAQITACDTVSGASVGAPCVFPFTFGGVKFNGCITISDPDQKPWCSTKVDENGVHIGGQDQWGHCDLDNCPISDDPRASDSLKSAEDDYEDEEEEEEKVELTEFIDCQTNAGETGKCKPPSLCIGFTEEDEQENSCELQPGNSEDLGVCCTEFVSNVEGSTEPKLTEDQGNETIAAPEQVTLDDVENVISIRFNAEDAPASPPVGNQPDEITPDTSEVDESDPTFFHLLFNKPSEEAVNVDSSAQKLQQATKTLQDNKGLTKEEAGIGLRFFNGDNTQSIRELCPWLPGPKCDESAKYRSFDGSCNNLREPVFGQATTPYQRILKPQYSEGSIFLPRKAKNGFTELPSARLVSNIMTTQSNVADSIHTTLVMQMGQFIDHDITHTPNHGVHCCGSQGTLPTSFDTEKCFPIEIPSNDPFWQNRKTCLSFARSLSSPGIKCSLEFRQQMNQITHWLDGSNIYGSNEKTAKQLRRNVGGLLKVSDQRRGRTGDLPVCSHQRSASEISMCGACKDCFFAGDVRANEHLNLIVMHTVWMREHNRIATQLRKVNPLWFDEKLYQEARRITIAEYQHIIYKEWLPIILGNQYMTAFNLWPVSKGYSKNYRNDFDPRITNEFATAAYRFGHSLIPPSFERKQRGRLGRETTSNMNMREIFFKPTLIRSQSSLLDEMAKGLASQEAEFWDDKFVKDITDHLFETRPGAGGLDLVALNIQRGRDHGLPGYNSYREICRTGVGKARDWSDFEDFIPRNQVEKLKQLYKDVDDVDLFVGGFLEIPDGDSILGPTFKCIVGDQFTRLKIGDRFFYDLGENANLSFTPEQLQEIRKTSMARILCDNVDGITEIQPQAFKTPGSSRTNILHSCNSINIPSLNINAFREIRRIGKR